LPARPYRRQRYQHIKPNTGNAEVAAYGTISTLPLPKRTTPPAIPPLAFLPPELMPAFWLYNTYLLLPYTLNTAMSSNYELVSFIDCRDIYNTPELLSFD
jgi:hypothetical protein